MKLARFTSDEHTRLGVVVGDEIADVGSVERGLPTDVGELLAAGGLDRVPRLVDAAARLPLDAVRLEAPIIRPPEFLAIGLNYAAHLDETGMDKPDVPVVFNKQVTCVNGPFDPIILPAAAPDHVDYEGELGVVIGRRCRAVDHRAALDVVAGYLVVDDVSVRDWQMRSPTLTMGKSWDTHGPIGPWLVTADEIGDPQDLRIRTWVDDVHDAAAEGPGGAGVPNREIAPDSGPSKKDSLRQDESTGSMIHDCAELIAHLSTAFTLLPGTVIATGTPAGVGFRMEPPQMLRAGQHVRIEIDAIGSIDNPVVAERPST